MRDHRRLVQRDAGLGHDEGDRPVALAGGALDHLRAGDPGQFQDARLDLQRVDQEAAEPQHVALPAEESEAAVDRFVAMLRARPGRNASRLSLSTAEGYLGTIRTFHMQRDKLDDAPLMAPPRAGSVGKRPWKPYGGHPYTDRKSRVEGKSGSVRYELGCGRISQKKKKI